MTDTRITGRSRRSARIRLRRGDPAAWDLLFVGLYPTLTEMGERSWGSGEGPLFARSAMAAAVQRRPRIPRSDHEKWVISRAEALVATGAQRPSHPPFAEVPPPARPTWAERAAVRRLVEDAFSARKGQGAVRVRLAGRLGVAAVVGLAVVASGAASAAVLGSPVPDPVRQASYRAGLPVESVDLHRVRHEIEALEHAENLHRGDSAHEIAERLREDLAHLSAKEHAEVGPRAEHLLEHAGLPAGEEPPEAGTTPAPTGHPTPDTTDKGHDVTPSTTVEKRHTDPSEASEPQAESQPHG